MQAVYGDGQSHIWYIKNVHLSVCKVLFIPKIAVSVKVS
jgi:hypothetical protein